jgi:HlyD family secretion protein
VMSEVAKDIRETETKITELGEREITAEDALRRTEIKAPTSGTVHQLNVHTVGGVVAPSEALMLIVPLSERLIVEARVATIDIDQVTLGQPARLRLSAFNQNTTPELDGTVFRVGVDAVKDTVTQTSHYLIGVEVSEAQFARLQGFKLVSGMPVEVFLRTGERTFASIVAKPFIDNWKRTLR